MSKRPKKTTTESGTPRERQLRAKVDDLEQELLLQRALRKPLAVLDRDNAEVITQLTQLFVELQDAGHPLRSTPIEAQHTYKHPDSSIDEGAATRIARETADQVRRRVRAAIRAGQDRLTGDTSTVQRPPQVRCVNQECPAYAKPLPRNIGPRREIELVHCPTCSGQLTDQEVPPLVRTPKQRHWTRSCPKYGQTLEVSCNTCGGISDTG